MKNLITCLVVSVLNGTALADIRVVADGGKADSVTIKTVVDADGAFVQPDQKSTSQNIDRCGTVLNPEYQQQIQRMLADGSWYEATHNDLSQIRGTTYVKTTFHILRYADGSGGMLTSNCQLQIDNLNSHIEGTGLEFCIAGILFHDLVDPSVDYYGPDPTYGFVPNTMNVYCTPYITGISACGYASYPPWNTFVVDNDCMEPGTTTFSHETGHYFGLPHTFEGTEDGSNPECVDGSNCLTAGDYICDTNADDNGGFDYWLCYYNGGGTDACNGDTYTPNTDNLMSYSWDACVDEFTGNQLSLITSIAFGVRSNLISADPCVIDTGACCNDSGTCIVTWEDACSAVEWNWQGFGTACENGCEQNETGACCVGEQCIQLPMQSCLSGGGTWIGAGISCEDGMCVGACCVGEQCIQLTMQNCLSGSGTWMGDGISCEVGICDQTRCEGDTDGSGAVDVGDLLTIIEQWGSDDSVADINGDGIVDVADLLAIVGNWGPCE